jgi:uncharacterized protein (TIGR02266 family)
MSTPKAAPIENRGAERREHFRHDMEVEVGFETESNFFTGLTQDISEGGLFVATHDLKPVGTIMKIQFNLPGAGGPMTIESEVRWLRESSSLHRSDGPHGMGLRFLNLSDEQKNIITNFLTQRESLFYDDL